MATMALRGIDEKTAEALKERAQEEATESEHNTAVFEKVDEETWK